MHRVPMPFTVFEETSLQGVFVYKAYPYGSAIGLLLASTFALAALALWPQPGGAVLALFRQGQPAATVFLATEAGWLPVRLLSLAGFGIAVARPADPQAPTAALRQAGAWLVLGWPGPAGCSPDNLVPPSTGRSGA
jgi:hypothetical protein